MIYLVHIFLLKCQRYLTFFMLRIFFNMLLIIYNILLIFYKYLTKTFGYLNVFVFFFFYITDIFLDIQIFFSYFTDNVLISHFLFFDILRRFFLDIFYKYFSHSLIINAKLQMNVFFFLIYHQIYPNPEISGFLGHSMNIVRTFGIFRFIFFNITFIIFFRYFINNCHNLGEFLSDTQLFIFFYLSYILQESIFMGHFGLADFSDILPDYF